MNINKLFKHYWFQDGVIKSFYLDLEANKAVIKFSVRRIKDVNISRIKTNNLEPCDLELVFENLKEISLINKLPSMGYFLDFKTGPGTSIDEIELSIEVHDSSYHFYEKENWKITAGRLSWREI